MIGDRGGCMGVRSLKATRNTRAQAEEAAGPSHEEAHWHRPPTPLDRCATGRTRHGHEHGHRHRHVGRYAGGRDLRDGLVLRMLRYA